MVDDNFDSDFASELDSDCRIEPNDASPLGEIWFHRGSGTVGEIVEVEYDGSSLQLPYFVTLRSRDDRISARVKEFREASLEERTRYVREGEEWTAEWHLRRARECAREMKYSVAAQHSNAAAQMLEGDTQLWLAAAEYHVMAGEFDAAVSPLRRYLHERPSDFEATLFLVVALSRTGNTQEAVQLLKLLRHLSDKQFDGVTNLYSEALCEELIDVPYVNVYIDEERVRRFPEDPACWHDLACACDNANIPVRAEEAYIEYFKRMLASYTPAHCDVIGMG